MLFSRSLPLALSLALALADLLELHVELLEARLQARTFTEIERFDGAPCLVHGCKGRAADGGGGVLEEAAGKGGWPCGGGGFGEGGSQARWLKSCGGEEFGRGFRRLRARRGYLHLWWRKSLEA